MGFWKRFWNSIKKASAEDAESDRMITAKVQAWEDFRKYNPLDIVVTKLTTLANDEATIELETDSTLVEPLHPLCKDIEQKRYDICSMMLGKGGAFVTLATTDDGKPYHRIVSPGDVSVYRMVADMMFEVGIVIEKKFIKNREYRLIRHHLLDTDGTLYVYYYATDSSGNIEYVPEWEHYKDEGIKFIGANNIGIAYFKSPQNSRGLEQFFGVPLNFGCEEVEQLIINDRVALEAELKNAESKLFADESILRMKQTSDGTRYDLPENVYTIKKKAGTDGSLIDVFSPATRFSDYLGKLRQSCADYEDQIGVNRGFLTEPELTSNATATEVRRSNVQTISMMKKIQSALFKGISEVLEADSIFLGIASDLWSVKVDWYNPFEDEASQYERIFNAAQNGYAEADDVMKWLFPNLTAEEIDEKIVRIKEGNKVDSEAVLESIIGGGGA